MRTRTKVLTAILMACASNTVMCVGDSPSPVTGPGGQDASSGADARQEPTADASAQDASAQDAGAQDTGAPDAAADAPVTGTATLAVLCNGAPVAAFACTSKRWELDVSACEALADGGAKKMELRNSGTYPIAYMARQGWGLGVKYLPGVPKDGAFGELTGILEANATVDITSAFAGGIFALVGSVRPFAQEAYSAPKNDEGTVPWSQGSLGSHSATQLFVAQVSVRNPGSPCVASAQFF